VNEKPKLTAIVSRGERTNKVNCNHITRFLDVILRRGLNRSVLTLCKGTSVAIL
jgi:hypothetical protein